MAKSKTRYRIQHVSKIANQETATLVELDARGAVVPGSTIQVCKPKGSGVAEWEPDALVEVQLNHVSAS